MDIFCVDFETYYGGDYTLSKMTTEQYVRDPRFEVIGVGVRFPVGSVKWMEAAEFAAWVKTVDQSQAGILGHHTHFDGLILAHHFGVVPAFWFCTLSMARALHGTQVGGSLAKLMRYYGVGEKGTEVIHALGKHRQDFSQQEWLQYGDYCKTDVRGTWALFEAMLQGAKSRPFPTDELRVVDMTIRMFTEPALVLDEARMVEYVKEEQARKEALVAKVAGATKNGLMSNEQFAAMLVDLGVDPPMKWSEKKQRMDFACAKKDPGIQDLLEHEDERVREVVEARLGIKSTINEAKAGRMLKLGAGGRPMPVYLNYAKAHTFRWTGGDKVQWHNLERTDKNKPEKGAIRKAVMAPPGHVVVACDSAQIEARVLAWLAGQEDLVEAFRNKRDVYSEFASEVYRRHVDRKKNKEDETPGQVGKVAVLGLGFGLGARKAAMTFAAGPMGAAPVIFTEADADAMSVDVIAFAQRPCYSRSKDDEGKTNLDMVAEMPSRLPLEACVVHVAVCDHIVRTYRKRHQSITGFWKVADSLIEIMHDGGEMSLESTSGHTIIEVVGADADRGLLLPSGLVMKYPGLRMTKGGDYVYRGGRVRRGKDKQEFVEESKVYGGLVTENTVQALSRIIISDQALEVHDAGIKLVTTTHDELVAVARESEAEATLAFMLKTMKTPPKWAPDLPLSAEGGFSARYGMAKT